MATTQEYAQLATPADNALIWGNDYVKGGGGDPALRNAIYLVAAYACHSSAVNTFHCDTRPLFVNRAWRRHRSRWLWRRRDLAANDIAYRIAA